MHRRPLRTTHNAQFPAAAAAGAILILIFFFGPAAAVGASTSASRPPSAASATAAAVGLRLRPVVGPDGPPPSPGATLASRLAGGALAFFSAGFLPSPLASSFSFSIRRMSVSHRRPSSCGVRLLKNQSKRKRQLLRTSDLRSSS